MRTLLRPRRLLMWTLMGHRRGLTMRGTLGGSRSLAGGTWTGTHLFGGTLLGDVVAAAGGGAVVQFLGLVVVVPVVQGRPVVVQSLDKVVDMPLLPCDSSVLFLGKVVELPLLCNDRCLGLTVLSGEVPLLQYIDSRRHHCRGGQTVQTVEVPQLQFSWLVTCPFL